MSDIIRNNWLEETIFGMKSDKIYVYAPRLLLCRTKHYRN